MSKYLRRCALTDLEKSNQKCLTKDISHLSKSCKFHLLLLSYDMVVSSLSARSEELCHKNIHNQKRFLTFLGRIQTLSKSCERHLHSCSLMPWQQSEACQLWSLLSSEELCHIETSGDGGSHQDHIMTVCQITPTSLIMVWPQLRQYSAV